MDDGANTAIEEENMKGAEYLHRLYKKDKPEKCSRTGKELHPKFKDQYHSKGPNDLNLPMRIMTFVSQQSQKVNTGQGNLSMNCSELWDMSEDDFMRCFGLK